MIQRQLDPNSQQFLSHVDSYASGETQVDADAVAAYVSFVKRTLLPTTPDVLECPILRSFIPLLSNIINSNLNNDVFSDLLQALLEQLPFADTLKFFDPEFVVRGIQSEAHAVVRMVAAILHHRVMLNDSDAVQCVEGAMEAFLGRTLSEPQLPSSVVAQVEELAAAVPQSVPLDLLLLVKPALSDTILMTRYLEIVAIVKQVETLADFDMEIELKSADPFRAPLLVDFYTRFPLKKQVDVIVGDLARQRGNETSFAYASQLNLLASLTHTHPEWATTYFVKYPSLHDFTFDNDADYFCKLNLDALPKQTFDWSINKVLESKFHCVMHLVSSPVYFQQLVANLNLSVLSKLPLNRLFDFLSVCSRYSYSTEYTLTLPSVMQLLLDTHASTPEVWETKKTCLENLLSKQLGVWEEKVKAAYSLMLNGQAVRNRNPRVDVLDEAL